jgi:flagella basal body P-ring formation protein FlgA
MKMFGLILFLVSISAFADECSIELFSKVYRLDQNQSLQTKDIIRASTCSEEVAGRINSLVSNSQGTVGTDFLIRELEKDFPEKHINFTNKKMSLLDLNSTMKEQLLPGTNLYFNQSRSLNNISSLGLVEGETLQAVCDACQSFGEKNVKINVINVTNNSSRTLWFASKIMAKLKVVKAKRSISFQQKSLDANDFFIDEVLTMIPDNALTTLDNIQFYKANRTLLQGSVVSNMDLQAVNLINFGTPATVLLKSNNISLQKSAMPARSARFGDIVELRGPNNKMIAGKVIDYNKVVIEL